MLLPTESFATPASLTASIPKNICLDKISDESHCICKRLERDTVLGVAPRNRIQSTQQNGYQK